MTAQQQRERIVSVILWLQEARRDINNWDAQQVITRLLDRADAEWQQASKDQL